jgi:hypothetical protein
MTRLPSCPFCGQVFDNDKLLANHYVNIHMIEEKSESFLCPICSEPKSNIIDHMHKHHPHHCAYCAKGDEPDIAHRQCVEYLGEARKFRKALDDLIWALKKLVL